MGGVGGNGASVPSSVQPIEMYGYTQAGLASAKRLRVQEIFNWYVNGTPESSTQKLDLDATYTYYPGGEGKVLSVNYPTTYSWNSGTSQLVPTTGPTYTYAFDSMMRPTGLTDQSNNTDVSNVTYNAANQLLGLNYLGTAETRQYNNLNQMTNLTAGSGINIAYTFPAGANNGKISQQTNSVSGETVTYQYDSLNRLLSATSNQSWSETYGYDGFGNLLSKTPTGGAPTLSQSVNAANNWFRSEPAAFGDEQPKLERNLRLRWIRQPAVEDADRGRTDSFAIGERCEQLDRGRELRRERQSDYRRVRLRCGESSGDSNGDSVWLRFAEQASVVRGDVGLHGDADGVFLWRGWSAAGDLFVRDTAVGGGRAGVVGFGEIASGVFWRQASGDSDERSLVFLHAGSVGVERELLSVW